MGNMNSSSKKDIVKPIKPLSYNKSKNSTKYDLLLPVQYQVDDQPLYDIDSCMIKLEPQGRVIEFEIEDIGHDLIFKNSQIMNLIGDQGDQTILADQILLPLCYITKIKKENAILTIQNEENMHIRILNRQLNQIWWETENQLQIFGSDLPTSPWSIKITDHRRWSTSSE